MTDPIDETRPHPTSPTAPAAPAASPSGAAAPAEPASPSTGADPRIDPDRPPTDWREPPWFPARTKDRGPNLASLVFGLILVAIGLWFFVDRTLGIALPRIQWSTIWPVILIGIGALVLVRSVKRNS
jgi:hypothetical protein